MDEKKNWSSIDIIAPDENYDGIFYKYSDKKNVYLIYDDAKGNKQAYINTKDIFSTLKKNKIKYDRSYIYKVEKIFDAANSELANKSKTVGRFLYLGNGRFAYTTVRDYQDYYVNVINIK